MDGYGWAGTSVTIKRLNQTGRDKSPEPSETMKIRAMLRGVMERRYDFETKFLDLSALRQDEELNAQKVFDLSSTTSKFFPAMMAVLEKSFESVAEKNAAITSVSLANNELEDLGAVTSLAQTLPRLLNLDLSNNKFAKLSALELWRKRFPNLQHLILTSNPIEQAEPNYIQELMKWYRSLQMLNRIQVRTEEDVVAKRLGNDLPFPIRSPLFQDENGIAENFIRTVLAGYDNNRAALAAHYYDDRSEFSFSVNTAAPRDNTEQTEKQEWDHYIKGSRNLKKITHAEARQKRLFRGTKAIADAFAALPQSRHPDLASEASKYMIEAHIQPGLLDPTGVSPHGVDGFFITIHGQFAEVDNAGQAMKTRSFDRTFILGAGGQAGVRVVCDLFTIRSFGGVQAFDPKIFESLHDSGPRVQALQNAENTPQLPAGVTIDIAEQMVIEMQKQTGMTVGYAKDCLEQVGWDYEKGLAAFASVRTNLPSTAFV
nr:mrna export factor mex67 [Quercus suber]